ncbi:MAG TPA: putative 2OG-Fe(II) oxygenase [Rhizomicrobium sp.]|nr:putative 2OG-Fe(II) oxygenase [Rhizomicrobium sp.]
MGTHILEQARTALAKGDIAAAERALNDAGADAGEALVLRAHILLARGKISEAETFVRGALVSQHHPRVVAGLEHLLGLCLRRDRRPAEALTAFERAYARAPDTPGLAIDRADELQVAGRTEDAVAAYRAVLNANPLDARAHRQLSHLLYRLGDDANFLNSYDEAMAKHPARAILPLSKAAFLFQLERFDEAEACYARAEKLLPEAIAPLNGLAATAARKGDYARAIAAHQKAVKLAPRHADSQISYCETLLRAGDAKLARTAAETAVQLAPDDQGAIAFLTLALRASNDQRTEEIDGFEKFVQVFELAPPKGFSSTEDFNAALNAELDALHGSKRELLNQSLRGGTQTLNDLFSDGYPLVDLLRAQIDDAVASYIATLPDDAQHPLLRRKRSDFDYNGSWSSRLSDCGFHTNHVHPKGWISSAYYVALPDAVADEKGQQGWIKFGEPSFDAHLKDPIRRVVQPRTGTLVLFPSYMWHGTVPFRSDRARTTIAFDVVPR